MPAHAIIELRDVDIDAGDIQLVRRLSVDVAPGRVLAIVSERPAVRAALGRILSGDIADYRIGGDLVLEGRELVSRVGNVMQAEAHVARIAGPLDVRTRVRDLAPADVLERVGLEPSEQRVQQLEEAGRVRAAFAQALASAPRVLVLELNAMPDKGSSYPVWSSLLHRLARDAAEAIVVCTDSMAVAADVADEVLVTLDGRAVEAGSVYDVCLRPAMPYVQDLVRLTPSPHRSLPEYRGFVDIAAHQGCPWVLNCRAEVLRACSQAMPAMREVELGHHAACHLLAVGQDA